jgi:tetratricopeptide (TPR) repeat protein
VPELLKSLNDRHPFVRNMVAVALLKIAPESEYQIPPEVLSHARERIEDVEKNGGRYGIGYVPVPEPKSDKAATYLDQGHEFYERKDFDAALASFTKAIEINRNYAEAYYERGLVYRVRGENDAALADFTQAINTASDSHEMHYHARGLTQLARQDFDAAIADFNEVIKLDGYYYADAYFSRGIAHQRKGKHDAAIADFDRALGFIPPVTEAYGSRAISELAQGKVTDAIADFNEAVKAEPRNYANYEGLGDAYARMGNTERARAAWINALSGSSDVKAKVRLNRKLNGAANP